MTGIIFPKEHFQVYKDSKEDDKKLENRWLENLKRRKLKYKILKKDSKK